MLGKKSAPGSSAEERPGRIVLPEDRVHLKPILGLRPGIYLAGLYALILLGFLFFILLYPGITNPGSLLVFNSEPQGAGVRIDGLTQGMTPCEVFVPQGSRVIELILPGFTSFRQERVIPGSVFASRFFPRRIALSETLKAEKPLEALILGAVDYAGWSFTGEPTATYQIPQDLSEGAYRSGPGAADPAGQEAAAEILKGAARFAATKAALRDLLRAQFITHSGGLAPSPLTFTDSAAAILEYLSETPGAALWLMGVLPPDAAHIIEDSPWRQGTIAEAASAAALPPLSWSFGETIRLGGLVFRKIPAGAMIQGSSFPRRVSLENYYMALTEISPGAWEAFLQARPQWRGENRKTLIEQGLVSEGYLAPSEYPPNEYPGVPGISWYAARAYGEWLTTLLPPDLAGWEVRLPTEAEWEYAAKFSLPEAREGSPEQMLGGLWEWCADPYAPFNFLPAPEAVIQEISSPERSVRGGSWINPPGSVGIETRGSLPPAASSAFVSFRPVIAPREEPAP